MSEKLQKVLARTGLGSRRTIEQWIAEGRVRVNGRIAKTGERVLEHDQISVDDRPVTQRIFKQDCRILALHKAEGVVCTRNDPEHRPTIFEDLPRLKGARWVAVGRLDINTAGLILLTTDGELAHRLMHPSRQIEREYAVRVFGNVTPEMIATLKSRVMLEDGPAHFDDVIEAGGSGINRWYHVVLKEGRQREVRRLWEALGVQVSRLTRVRYGPISLRRGLRAGKFEELDNKQVAELRELVGLAAEKREKARERDARERSRASSRQKAPKQPQVVGKKVGRKKSKNFSN
jgi:23S rRNA pseudouridine2605 synthase